MQSSISSPPTPMAHPLTESVVGELVTNSSGDKVIASDGCSSLVSSPANLDLGAADNSRGGDAGIKHGYFINPYEDEDRCDYTVEDDDSDDDNHDDLDDELMIPRSVSKKLKRDRLRKTEKRAFKKAGFVYSKQELGRGFKN